MKNKIMEIKWMVRAGIATLLPLALLANVQSSSAQTPPGCVYLQEVSTGQTSIQKSVSARGLGNNNWNTDFAVPAGTTFDYFIGHVYPKNNATYQVTISFRYNDNTSAQIFKNSIPMQRLKLYSQTLRAPTNKQPYQVNMNVGSELNNTYVVAVLGCHYLR